MNKEVTFIDPVSPRGHVSINKFYIEALKERKKKLIVSSELSALYSGICEVSTFSPQWLKKGRLLHSLYTFLLCLNTIIVEWRKNNSKIIFLS